MIKVSLIGKTNELPVNLISHAAKTCYTSSVPEIGNIIDVENNLFRTGHHTTLQHNYFTFNIDRLSVSSTIFGLHLTSGFYNTDQRSGRFSKMYLKPDFDEIKNYILYFWPNCDIENVMNFVKKGREIYKTNIKQATEIAEKFIKEERTNATQEYIDANAGKIAQEQMRMFLSTISPTALDYTLNLSTINAMYRSAWTPELREIFNQIKDIVLKEYPDLTYMFNEKAKRENNWMPEFNFKNVGIKKEPILHSTKFSIWNEEINLEEINKDSVDLRYFTPEFMGNSTSFIETEVEVSLATYAQDQRHRTIKRGIPKITGNFYLPPILQELNLEKEAFNFINEYLDLSKKIDKNLALSIAPYGLMVKYRKVGDLNGVIHEQEKRLCWSAQEEIYNLSRKLHISLTEKDLKNIAEVMCPSCYKNFCIEGKRYCGRDISKLKNDKSIPKRKI